MSEFKGGQVISGNEDAVTPEMKAKVEEFAAGLQEMLGHIANLGIAHFKLPKGTEVEGAFLIKLPLDPEALADADAVKGAKLPNPLGFAPMPGRGSDQNQ